MLGHLVHHQQEQWVPVLEASSMLCRGTLILCGRLLSAQGCPAWGSKDGLPPYTPLRSLQVVWQRKTPTRLPEALWLRLKPSPDLVNATSWVTNRLGTYISPFEVTEGGSSDSPHMRARQSNWLGRPALLGVSGHNTKACTCNALQVILNGSHSITGVQQERSLRVASADGAERLWVSSYDTPLAAMGKPACFPNPSIGPDMEHGMSFNLVWASGIHPRAVGHQPATAVGVPHGAPAAHGGRLHDGCDDGAALHDTPAP